MLWEKFKNLAIWQQGLFAVVILSLAAVALYKTGVIKLASSKPYDCSGVNSFQTLQINIGDKFDPENIDAYLCDHLVFKAVDSKGHWPAAGPHPTHTSYPGFDSKRTLNQDQTFEFVLNKAGSFSFHDHLHEQITGNLTVHDQPRQGNPPQRPE